jgi:hypothetical protein
LAGSSVIILLLGGGKPGRVVLIVRQVIVSDRETAARQSDDDRQLGNYLVICVLHDVAPFSVGVHMVLQSTCQNRGRNVLEWFYVICRDFTTVLSS